MKSSNTDDRHSGWCTISLTHYKKKNLHANSLKYFQTMIIAILPASKEVNDHLLVCKRTAVHASCLRKIDRVTLERNLSPCIIGQVGTRSHLQIKGGLWCWASHELIRGM